jgi:sugar lactone lactonase YvrE
MALNRRDVMRMGAAGGLWATVGLAGRAAADTVGAAPGAVATGAVATGAATANFTDTIRARHPAGGTLVLDTRAPSLSRVVGGKVRWRYALAGAQPGELNGPGALAVHPDGRCFVSNTGNDEVLVFGAEGQRLPTVGRRGHGPGELRRPRGIALDAEGGLWVADSLNHRVQRFDSNGKFDRMLGEQGPLGDAAGPRLNGPSGLVLSAEGSLWVADAGHFRVARYAIADGTFEGGYALAAPPRALALDALGNLSVLVGDQIHRLDRGAQASSVLLSQARSSASSAATV